MIQKLGRNLKSLQYDFRLFKGMTQYYVILQSADL